MITIKDIAEKLGVSVSTVSRALNNHPEINYKTKERVLAAFKEYQYTPNVLARSLIKKKTSTIGLLMPNITGEFYSSVANLIEDKLSEAGYHTLYGLFNDTAEKEEKNLVSMIERKVDGLIITPNFLSEVTLEMIQSSKIPTVFLRRRPPEEVSIPYVDVNYFTGAIKVIEYLHSKGHRNIGFVGLPEFSFAGQERYKGYLKAMEDLGLQTSAVISKGKSISGGSEAIQNLLNENENLTAVFAAHDILAVGVLEYFERNKINVPADMSVVGFGDLDISRLYWTMLTTVSQPIEKLADEVVRKIFIALSMKESQDNTLMETDLVIRNSTSAIHL